MNQLAFGFATETVQLSDRSNYGKHLPDVTPDDLKASGWVIMTHFDPGTYCAYRQNSKGGSVATESRDSIEDAIADARWLLPGYDKLEQQWSMERANSSEA